MSKFQQGERLYTLERGTTHTHPAYIRGVTFVSTGDQGEDDVLIDKKARTPEGNPHYNHATGSDLARTEDELLPSLIERLQVEIATAEESVTLLKEKLQAAKGRYRKWNPGREGGS